MSQIFLDIKDQKKFKAVITFLKELDLIESIESQKSINSISAFIESAGMWKNREIVASDLRKKAWRNDSL